MATISHNKAKTLPMPASSEKHQGFDELIRYVRVREVRDNRFVEFDFAIGDPSLYVELVLPQDAFTQFCHHNRVVMMTDEQARRVDADMEKWRYGEDALRAADDIE